MRRDLLQLFYLASAILFVMGLRGLSHPRTARRGMFLAELGMLLAIIGSLLHHEIIDYRWIAAGLGLGTAIGVPMAIWIPMTAVPQRTALSHSFGALAAALIGISEYYRHGAALGSLRVGVIALEVMLGSLTFTGSLMAAGKLQGQPAGSLEGRKAIRQCSIEEAAEILGTSRSVVFVPGYGMAVAQAQHRVREVADVLKSKGADVRYGIHAVAGRMPGHMNVLLAEANVPYDELYDMDQINSYFPETDVVVVVGTNDVVNPAAKRVRGSPIYGMPILEVEKARVVIVCKRSLAAGFAGIDNELYYGDKTLMLFGDAKETMVKLTAALKS